MLVPARPGPPSLIAQSAALDVGLTSIVVTAVPLNEPPTVTAAPFAALAGSGRPIAEAMVAAPAPRAAASRARRVRFVVGLVVTVGAPSGRRVQGRAARRATMGSRRTGRQRGSRGGQVPTLSGRAFLGDPSDADRLAHQDDGRPSGLPLAVDDEDLLEHGVDPQPCPDLGVLVREDDLANPAQRRVEVRARSSGCRRRGSAGPHPPRRAPAGCRSPTRRRAPHPR